MFASLLAYYGVMRWASLVPAAMMNAPPALRLSGKPEDAVVAPGIAIVWCRRAPAWSQPLKVLKNEPYSAFTRVPSLSAAATNARSPSASVLSA